MDFRLPDHLVELLAQLDAFIDSEIAPLQAADDNERFFDHRREFARTDLDNGGIPSRRLGGAAGRDAPPRRCRGLLPLRPAGVARRARRHEPRHGGHTRAPGGQGARVAQRPPERGVDRRQPAVRPDPARVRDRRAARDGRADDPWRGADRVRADRAGPRQRRDVAGDDGGARRRRTGSSTAPSASTRACTTRRTTSSSPAHRASRARRAG